MSEAERHIRASEGICIKETVFKRNKEAATQTLLIIWNGEQESRLTRRRTIRWRRPAASSRGTTCTECCRRQSASSTSICAEGIEALVFVKLPPLFPPAGRHGHIWLESSSLRLQGSCNPHGGCVQWRKCLIGFFGCVVDICAFPENLKNARDGAAME